MTDDKVLYEKDGYKIHLEARSFQFRIDGPEGNYVKRFPDFARAQQWITTELREAAKTDRRVLDLKVLRDNGEPDTLVGVNLNTSKFKLASDGNFGGTLYPDTPRLRKLVRELHEARLSIRAINEQIESCAFSQWSSGRLESANYERYLVGVEKKYEKAAGNAAELEHKERAA